MAHQYPLDLINSPNWYITLPTKIKKTPDTVEMPELGTYSSEYFHLSDAGDGVVFKAPTDGATTKNSKNPRSELREESGEDHAAWSSTNGTHSMDIEQSIDVAPIGSKPHIVVGQIHDADDDVTVFRWEGNTSGDRNVGKLWITDGDTTHGRLVDDALRLGTRFRVGFKIAAGVISYTYNGQPIEYLQKKKITGCYFKAGSYCQSGGNVTKLPSGEADYAQVTIYALQVCHDGVCTGTAPGTKLPPVEPPVEPPVTPPTDNDTAKRLTALEAAQKVSEKRWVALKAALLSM